MNSWTRGILSGVADFYQVQSARKCPMGLHRKAQVFWPCLAESNGMLTGTRQKQKCGTSTAPNPLARQQSYCKVRLPLAGAVVHCSLRTQNRKTYNQTPARLGARLAERQPQLPCGKPLRYQRLPCLLVTLLSLLISWLKHVGLGSMHMHV